MVPSVTCVDEVLVGEARVVDIVDSAGEDGGHDLQRGEALGQGGAGQQQVGGLGHICCVKVVVVRHSLNIITCSQQVLLCHLNAVVSFHFCLPSNSGPLLSSRMLAMSSDQF